MKIIINEVPYLTSQCSKISLNNSEIIKSSASSTTTTTTTTRKKIFTQQHFGFGCLMLEPQVNLIKNIMQSMKQ